MPFSLPYLTLSLWSTFDNPEVFAVWVEITIFEPPQVLPRSLGTGIGGVGSCRGETGMIRKRMEVETAFPGLRERTT